jgi:WhiB family redox-sensing transcriptional regulator
MDWRHRAECADLPADLADKTFFPDRGHGADSARAICGKCSARAECLEFAMTYLPYDLYGVWGGLTPDERRKLPRQATSRHHSSQAEIRGGDPSHRVPAVQRGARRALHGPESPGQSTQPRDANPAILPTAKERKGEK